MGADPGSLPKLPDWAVHPFEAYERWTKERQRAEEAARRAAQRAAEEERFLKSVGPWLKVNGFDMGKQAFQLEKELPRDLNLLMSAINDTKVPIERRAKLLEVVILRAAQNKLDYWGADNTPAYYKIEVVVKSRVFHPTSDEYRVLKEQMEYQLAAMTAVISGPPELFGQLSKSADALPTGRAPATEWMNTMLREWGIAGNHERRQPVETWMKQLPAETRGRAMFHLRDAAEAKEIGKVARITGVELSVMEVGAGLSWEYPPDTQWKEAGDDLMLGVMRDLDQKREEKAAFYTGYLRADPGLEDPKDFVKDG